MTKNDYTLASGIIRQKVDNCFNNLRHASHPDIQKKVELELAVLGEVAKELAAELSVLKHGFDSGAFLDKCGVE